MTLEVSAVSKKCCTELLTLLRHGICRQWSAASQVSAYLSDALGVVSK